MKRVMIVVAYDGTKYCGWQVQPNGVTIQEVLERHLSELLKEPVSVLGASRTDAGVHALEMQRYLILTAECRGRRFPTH